MLMAPRTLSSRIPRRRSCSSTIAFRLCSAPSAVKPACPRPLPFAFLEEEKRLMSSLLADLFCLHPPNFYLPNQGPPRRAGIRGLAIGAPPPGSTEAQPDLKVYPNQSILVTNCHH